jgi:DinB superfamily
MKEVADDLRRTVERDSIRLLAIPAATARMPLAPGKWSPAQIIGHLVDSASHNHGRFVRAQLADDLFFPGYDQEVWVRIQDYNETEWRDLVALWRTFNLHIAHVIERIPSDAATKPRTYHNLDEIAWKTVPRSEPVTLEYFVRDYVAHMRHHLGQIPQ